MRHTYLLAFVMSLQACSNNPTTTDAYRAEADRYCHVHSEDYWVERNLIEKLDELSEYPTKKSDFLASHISATVTSTAMKKVIYEGATLAVYDYYAYLQQEIPKLTGEPFNCRHIDAFYLGTPP